METSSLVKRDQKCIWHPFTQAQTAASPIPIVAGNGVYLYAEDGRSYLDAISSWWVNLHGHANPYITKKISEQAAQLEHVLFAGYTHLQAITLAERLLALSPQGLTRVFYSDNGSTAVETAIKMALQVKGSGKTLLSFQGGYHGDTFGAMSASGKNSYNHPFWPYLFQIYSISPPLRGHEEQSWAEFERALKTENIAAFIFEPLLQGAGGMLPHSKIYLKRMIKTCHDRGIITIADEVMTGFGRTGPLFACNTIEETPDILCLSKGITGGFLPLGATLAKEYLYEAFLSNELSRAFLHGHSYTANPLACAAANASLDLLEENSSDRDRIQHSHLRFQNHYAFHPKLKRCDVVGTILILEYSTQESSYFDPLSPKLTSFFQKEGILVRPLGNVLYILPPYCITNDELQKIYETIEITLTNWP